MLFDSRASKTYSHLHSSCQGVWASHGLHFGVGRCLDIWCRLASRLGLSPRSLLLLARVHAVVFDLSTVKNTTEVTPFVVSMLVGEVALKT
jgi:hypothetical protein